MFNQRVPTGVNVWMGQRDGKSGAPVRLETGMLHWIRCQTEELFAHARPHLTLSLSRTHDVVLYQPTEPDVMLY